MLHFKADGLLELSEFLLIHIWTVNLIYLFIYFQLAWALMDPSESSEEGDAVTMVRVYSGFRKKKNPI